MNYQTPFALLLVLTFLIGADYLTAWTAPTALPPSSNVAAPVNVGDAPQAKPGLLGVNELIANAVMIGRSDVPTADFDVAANGSIAAAQYCDQTGNNCWDPATGAPNVGSGFGYDQTWRSMFDQRSSNVWYHNNTDKPIMLYVGSSGSGGTGLYVNTTASDTGRIKVDGTDADSGERVNMTSVVPPNAYYKYIGNIVTWSELR